MFKSDPHQKKYAQEDLIDFAEKYNKSVDAWFEAKVIESGVFYEGQQKKYDQLKSKDFPTQGIIE